MSISTTVDLQVPFHDIDMLGIAWHGHYAKYLEIARCNLLDSIDYGYMAMQRSGYSWPIIDMHIRYIAPLRFEQRIHILATLIEYEYRLKINYQISDHHTRSKIAKAHTTQVAVKASTQEMCYASPQIILDKVAAAQLKT